MFVRTIVSGILFVAASAAFGSSSGSPIQDVSLDDLKAKCKELTSNPQIKPVKVRVTCSDLSHFWQAGENAQGLLSNDRKTGALVQMKGFQVPHTLFSIPVEDSPVACPTYVKMERTVSNVDVELSCPELLEIDDLGNFCAPIVDDRAAQDPGLVTVTPTKEVLTFCN